MLLRRRLKTTIRNASRRFFLLWVLLFSGTLVSAGVAREDIRDRGGTRSYIWPTNASRSLSSTFAETREGHFHFGLDIRTNHSEGYPCYAVADGDVVRLRVSPYGYGKALYLRLKDGRLAVYAHLQRFAPEIERIVEKKQYETRSYRCQMVFEPGELSFKQGDIIAYSGSTGIGVPHLHFEIREEDGYRNALLYGFDLEDTIPPTPAKLAFIPLDFGAEVNGGFEEVVETLKADQGEFLLEDTPSVYGTFGLAVSCFDRLNGAQNRVGVYGFDFYLDDSLCFSARYDAIRYPETKQIELERDFRLKRRGKGVFHHLWRDSLSTLEFYKAGDGMVDTRDYPAGKHFFEIVVLDFAGNAVRVTGELDFKSAPVYPKLTPFSKEAGFFGILWDGGEDDRPSEGADLPLQVDFRDDRVLLSFADRAAYETVDFFIKAPFRSRLPAIRRGKEWIGKAPLIPLPAGDWVLEVQVEDTSGTVLVDSFEWHLQPVLSSGGAVLSDDGLFNARFEPQALYRTLYARVIEEPPPDDIYKSKIYRLEPGDVPIRGDVEVTIEIPADQSRSDKLGIYYLTRKGKWSFIDNDLRSAPGAVFGRTPSLESYVLIEDTAPPELRWLSPALTTSDRRPVFKLAVADELSGVDDRTISLLIDGEWLLMEYDYEEDRMTGRPPEPLSVGEHNVTVTVRDFNGNEAALSRVLTIITP